MACVVDVFQALWTKCPQQYWFVFCFFLIIAWQALEMIEQTEKEAMKGGQQHIRKKTHKGEVEVDDEDMSTLVVRTDVAVHFLHIPYLFFMNLEAM